MQNEGQNHLDEVLKTEGSNKPRSFTSVASETVTLNGYDRHVDFQCPASGTGVIKMPSLADVEDGAEFTIYCRGTNGTGQVTLKSAGDQPADAATPADLIGDNFSAAGDYAIVKRVRCIWVVIKEVTT